jgi:uncharacterized membrane protein
VYAFYIDIASIVAVVLAPFAFYDISVAELFLYFCVGAAFFGGLTLYYYVLSKEEVTRIAPVIAGFYPVFILLLNNYFLGQSLRSSEYIAFVLLVAGSMLAVWHKNGVARSGRILLMAVAVAGLYAVSDALFKSAFIDGRSFVGALFWTKVLAVPLALLLLIFPRVRRDVFGVGAKKDHAVERGVLVVMNKVFGGLASITYRYALFYGNIAIISAMSGLQYIFLFLLAVFFSKKYPHLLEEPLTAGIVGQKLASFALIGVGIAVLFLA